MLIVSAYESRSITGSILTSVTFDNAKMNWTAAAEIVLAVMITQMDLFNRLLKTVPLTAGQFGLALASAVLLLVLWERGQADRPTSLTTRGCACFDFQGCARSRATGCRGCAATSSPGSC